MTLELNRHRTHALVDLSQLVALASAVVHADELHGPDGHAADLDAFRTSRDAAGKLLDALDKMALLPVRRSAP